MTPLGLALVVLLAIAGGLGLDSLTRPFVLAQDPATTCQDQVRVLRVLVEQYVAARQRSEFDAAQTIAELSKQLEKARADLEVAKKK